VTIVGNHLVCDCSKAIKSATCPRQMISPKVKNSFFYFYCQQCNFDYICTQATKAENGVDKFGYPAFKKTVCRKCENEVEQRRWPE